MRVVGLPAGDTLKLGTEHGDVVVFLASGQVEQSLTDAAGQGPADAAAGSPATC